MTALTFYLCFQVLERIQVKTSSDPVVDEFWETLQLALQAQAQVDPNLSSVSDGLDYLTVSGGPSGQAILASGRALQIKQGIIQ